MKRLLPVLALFVVLFVGCGTESLVGPQDEMRNVVPAEDCNPDWQPC